MTTISAERVARVFVEVADTLVAEFDLIDFYHLLATRTANLLDASAVGLLIADHRGRLEFMGASDENVRLLELFQVQEQEGPCLDAYRTGEPVVNADLREATLRWPAFAPHASAAGYRSVHAFPLRLRADRIGALNVFSAKVGGYLGDADIQIVQAIADIATIALLQEQAITRGEVLTEQLQGALNSRIIVEQAKGTLAQARGVSVDQAFELMRAYSRSHGRRLGDVAHIIISDLRSLPELANP